MDNKIVQPKLIIALCGNVDCDKSDVVNILVNDFKFIEMSFQDLLRTPRIDVAGKLIVVSEIVSLYEFAVIESLPNSIFWLIQFNQTKNNSCTIEDMETILFKNRVPDRVIYTDTGKEVLFLTIQIFLNSCLKF